MSVDRRLWSPHHRPANRRARTVCRLTDASKDQTIGLLIGAPGLRVGRQTPLVTKQSACSSARQDCVSVDRRLWSPHHRPANRRARTVCRLTDASKDQTIGLLIGAPGLRVGRQTPLVTKQSACSSARQDCVSVDRRFWWPRNGPAHRLDKTGCRLTDASGHQPIGLLIGAPGLRVGRQTSLVATQPACSSTRSDCVSVDRRL